MSITSNFKKAMTSIILFLMLFMGMSTCTAFAENSKTQGSLDNFKVSMTDKGMSITGGGDFDSSSSNAWNNFFEKYKKFIVGISGIGAITMVGCFIFCFMKLGASSTNPQARQQALTGVLWSGVAAAGLGAVTIIVGFFYSAFK